MISWKSYFPLKTRKVEVFQDGQKKHKIAVRDSHRNPLGEFPDQKSADSFIADITKNPDKLEALTKRSEKEAIAEATRRNIIEVESELAKHR